MKVLFRNFFLCLIFSILIIINIYLIIEKMINDFFFIIGWIKKKILFIKVFKIIFVFEVVIYCFLLLNV